MAGLWARIAGAARSVQAVQALTEAPTDVSEGVFLESVDAIVPHFHAPDGQTFDGTGRMRGYVWNDVRLMWEEATAGDIDMAGAAGKSDWSPGALIVDSPRGRFQLVPTGVGLSAGAGVSVTTEYLCTSKAGGSPA